MISLQSLSPNFLVKKSSGGHNPGDLLSSPCRKRIKLCENKFSYSCKVQRFPPPPPPPLHIIWVEPGTTTKCLIMTILLPFLVFCGQFSVFVAENGCALEVSITWPSPRVNLQFLHCKGFSLRVPIILKIITQN